MNFFLKPYPDEILLSVYARFLKYCLLNQVGSLSSPYHNRATFPLSIDLPTCLRNFVRATEKYIPWSVETIVRDHTLFPFYSAFLTKEKRRNVLHRMRSQNGVSPHVLAGLNTSALYRSRFAKFCSQCAKDDLIEFGEAYLHRAHQIPDILICSKHNVFLMDFIPDLSTLGNYKYQSLDNGTVGQSQPTKNTCPILNEIAIQSREILAGQFLLDIDSVKYRDICLMHGYFRNGRLRRKELSVLMSEFYSRATTPKLVEIIGDAGSWLSMIINSPSRIFHPQRHILVNNFLANLRPKVQDVQAIQYDHPYGHGPWICYNKASEHYLQPVVKNIDVKRNGSSGHTTCLFKCACGFEYIRSFSSSAGKKSIQYFQIRNYGELWFSKLAVLVSNGQPNSAIAKQLGVSPTTVKRVLYRKDAPKSNINASVTKNKGDWVKLLQRAGVSEARKIRPELYSWLYRLDRNWLLNENQSYKANRPFQLKLDWDEVDSKLCTEILPAVKRLQESHYKRRITKTVIAKLMPRGSYILSTDLNRLPRTRDVLSQNVETIMEFHVRKTKLAIESLQGENLRVTKARVIKKLGIKTASESVKIIEFYLRTGEYPTGKFFGDLSR